MSALLDAAVADAYERGRAAGFAEALEACTAILRHQQKRFLPSEGAYHVLESIVRDHFNTITKTELK